MEKMKMEISNLNRTNDTLTDALHNMTKKYRRLQRSSESRGAGRLSTSTRRLISSLGSGAGGDTPSADTSTIKPSTDLEPSTSQQPPSFLEPDESDHGSTLKNIMEEYKMNQLGPDPSSKHQDNVNAKMFRIRKFLTYMAKGKTQLSTLLFLNETSKIHA
ncbi:hypothetical protein R3I93_004681 [Phoxinus phoxinus]|uniref:Uncharacterized protein n=1 Tax=Phoxinus phoxinus TaxID=58324 RepID=A0AAN9DKT9_9TELE